MIVLTTVSSKKEAIFISKKLLDKKAAACVNFYKIKSLFWKEKLHKEKEFQLIIKTNNYKKVKKILLKHHSYDTPEIISLKFNKAYKKYKKWIKNSIKG